MNLPSRKLPRLSGYDYATPGAYFVTICTHNKRCLFGKIVDGELVGEARMVYSPIGKIAKNCLLEIENHSLGIMVDHWVIMPNHIHILFRIDGQAEQCPLPSVDISSAVGMFKAAVTRAVGKAYMPSAKMWQTSFHDHIIRDEADYQNIWQYISGNPSKWMDDRFYVAD